MNPKKATHVWQLSFEGAWTTSVVFLGNSRRVAAGNREGQILVWDLPEMAATVKATAESGKDSPPDHAPVKRLDGHTNAITHLAATADGKTLISASLDRTVRLWNPDAAATGNAEVVLDQSQREQKARRLPKDEKAKVLEAPGVRVETVASVHTFEGHKEWIKALSLSADGSRFISGDDACVSIVWDVAARKEITRWTGYNRVWVSSAALSPDGKTAFTAEYAGSRSSYDRPAAQARLWNADNGSLKLDLLKVWLPKIKDKDRGDSYGYARAWGALMGRGLVCAAFSSDGKMLAVGQGGETGTGKVHLIDVESGKIIRTVSGHRSGACDVKFSADGKYVLSSGRDTAVRICNVADGKEVATLGKGRGGQFKDWLHAIDISPDQQWVAGADIAGLVHLWRFDG